MGLFGAVFSILPFARARRDKRRDENPDRRRRGERAALLVKPDEATTTTTEGWVLRVVTLALVLACGVVWVSFASGLQELSIGARARDDVAGLGTDVDVEAWMATRWASRWRFS